MKKTPAKKLRWSLGLFTSAANGEQVVRYCKKDGTVVPYLAKTVTAKRATAHAVFVGITFAQARKRLLKQAKGGSNG